MEEVDYESWNSSELADALESNEEFFEDCLSHLSEEALEEVEVWQWDRSDLIGYAEQYLTGGE